VLRKPTIEHGTPTSAVAAAIRKTIIVHPIGRMSDPRATRKNGKLMAREAAVPRAPEPKPIHATGASAGLR
jgi:hypothetical protein